MKNHPTKDQPCINCGEIICAALNTTDNNAPFPGALSICADCGHLMVFADDMSFREPTAEEMVNLAGHKDVLDAMKIKILFKRDRDDA